eukprot:6482237-Amphidinium_carterae.6
MPVGAAYFVFICLMGAAYVVFGIPMPYGSCLCGISMPYVWELPMWYFYALWELPMWSCYALWELPMWYFYALWELPMWLFMPYGSCLCGISMPMGADLPMWLLCLALARRADLPRFILCMGLLFCVTCGGDSIQQDSLAHISDKDCFSEGHVCYEGHVIDELACMPAIVFKMNNRLGVRQRLAAADVREGRGERAYRAICFHMHSLQGARPSKLAKLLLEQWAWGHLSAVSIQAIAAVAEDDGCPHPDVTRCC